ncbi:3'-5' exonuclease domain-containing protein 2 [Opitutales bacterium]|nr:3'-5' exonuclease domain-containing protein 2 [Opitutales bacterium]MDB3957318.1 3'-5' exonuclease domain-containing protein 2 [Opitutales bacterium]
MSALHSNQGELPSRLEKSEINELPLIRFHGSIQVAEDNKSFRKFVNQLSKQKVLGFDIECKPNFKRGPNNPPALIQLATADQAFLFRLYPVMKLGPLIDILENPDIVKTGVAIKDDAYNLKKIEEFTPGGFEDLAPLAQSLKIEQTGLRNLTAIFFSQRLSKSAQLSNWQKSPLSPSQETYAATDAWISRELYLIMKARLAANSSNTEESIPEGE